MTSKLLMGGGPPLLGLVSHDYAATTKAVEALHACYGNADRPEFRLSCLTDLMSAARLAFDRRPTNFSGLRSSLAWAIKTMFSLPGSPEELVEELRRDGKIVRIAEKELRAWFDAGLPLRPPTLATHSVYEPVLRWLEVAGPQLTGEVAWAALQSEVEAISPHGLTTVAHVRSALYVAMVRQAGGVIVGVVGRNLSPLDEVVGVSRFRPDAYLHLPFVGDRASRERLTSLAHHLLDDLKNHSLQSLYSHG